MSTTEQAVTIAAKMYRCRKAAMQLYGEGYKAKVSFYIDVVKAIMIRHDIDVIKAVLELCEDQTIANNEIAVMMLMSAAIEITERE